LIEGIGVTKSYFIRHKNIAVRGDTLDDLWKQNKIAVHYPGDGTGPDFASIRLEDYQRADKAAIGSFKELSEQGGYVWAESESFRGIWRPLCERRGSLRMDERESSL
jgi:hypothetical protein